MSLIWWEWPIFANTGGTLVSPAHNHLQHNHLQHNNNNNRGGTRGTMKGRRRLITACHNGRLVTPCGVGIGEGKRHGAGNSRRAAAVLVTTMSYSSGGSGGSSSGDDDFNGNGKDRDEGAVVMVKRRRQPVRGTYDAPPPPGGRPPPGDGNKSSGGGGDGDSTLSNITKAFVAGAFILGMGAGIWFDSEVTFAPKNVASTVLVDTKTPNSEVCMANGYSSMVFDQRIFVSFNPFNVYVSQPEVKPGCVLRRANFNVLESRGLVDKQQVQDCKRNMNTFAFVGDLLGKPEVSCVYHSEEAENQFLKNPEKAIMTQNTASPKDDALDSRPPNVGF